MNNLERYRSGHNGADSKFFEELAVCSAKKAHKYRVFSGSKIEYFVVLSVSSFQKFLEEMRNNIHGELSEWSKVQHSKCCVPKRNLGFESLTLRQKSPKNQGFSAFLFCSFAQNRLKTMERTACFLERTRRFRAFWRIRTVKISSFRHHLKFRSTCCRNSPIREVPFR